MLGGGAYFIGVAVIALVAREVSDSRALAGVPLSIGVALAALSAFPLGRWMAHAGRRPALVTAHLTGALGAATILAGAELGSFLVVCVGGAMFGIGNAANLFARYAAADLPEPRRRARAISYVLFATAAGAVLAPNFVPFAADLADTIGLDRNAGPLGISVLAYLGAAAIIAARLRPDPLLVARRREGGELEAGPAQALASGIERSIWHGEALLAAAAMVTANVVMVAIMTMAPIHMADAGQSLGAIGLVLSIHFAGMFLPAPIAGWAADRFGRIRALIASALVLAAAGTVAALAPGGETPMMVAALLLLGLGWSLGLVAGSAMLTDSVPSSSRAQAQGTADLAMGLAGAGAGLAAGPALSAGGFELLGLAGCAAALVMLAVLAGSQRPPLTGQA